MSQEVDEHLVRELISRFRLYTYFGVAVIVTNLVVIIVHMSNLEMNKRYILFTLLSVAELVNGISFIATGIGREHQIHAGTFFIPLNLAECLVWFPWPTLLIFAGQLPAVLNLMLAVERVIAVQCSSWYRSVWTWKYKAFLGAIGYFLCIIGYILAVVASHLSDHINQTRMCAVMESTGIIYGSIHYTLISLAYLLSFVVVGIICMITRANRSLTPSEFRRQKILLSVIGVSVVFVSFPNIILIFDEWNIINADALFVGVAYCLFAISSTFNLFIYIAFRKDFRQQLLRLLCLNKNSAASALLTENSAMIVKVSTITLQRNSETK